MVKIKKNPINDTRYAEVFLEILNGNNTSKKIQQSLNPKLNKTATRNYYNRFLRELVELELINKKHEFGSCTYELSYKGFLENSFEENYKAYIPEKISKNITYEIDQYLSIKKEPNLLNIYYDLLNKFTLRSLLDDFITTLAFKSLKKELKDNEDIKKLGHFCEVMLEINSFKVSSG